MRPNSLHETVEPKRILMIAATPFFSDRGCHIRIYQQMRSLKESGEEVALATYPLGQEINGIETLRTPNFPGYKRISPGASWPKLYLDLFLVFTALKAFWRFRPTLLHAHQYEALLIAWLVKVLAFSRAPIVFDCQGSLVEELQRYNKLRNPFFKILERFLLRLPNQIVCSSTNTAESLLRTYHLPTEKLKVIPDGLRVLSLLRSRSEEERRKLKPELGIPPAIRSLSTRGFFRLLRE